LKISDLKISDLKISDLKSRDLSISVISVDRRTQAAFWQQSLARQRRLFGRMRMIAGPASLDSRLYAGHSPERC
jgi:hypothetical protein